MLYKLYKVSNIQLGSFNCQCPAGRRQMSKKQKGEKLQTASCNMNRYDYMCSS